MKLKKNILLICIISLSIVFVIIPDLDHSLGDLKPAPIIKLSWTSDDWHDGTNQSTNELTLEYKEIYQYLDGNWDGIDDGYLRQKMEIIYKDNTDTVVAFDFVYTFLNCTGIDVDNKNVTDWNELDTIDPHLTIETQPPPEYGLDESIHFETPFDGFNIYNGTSADINMTTTVLPGSWYLRPAERDWLGEINFRNCSMRIGQVTLGKENYSSNGTASIKSIAKFDIHINATIGYETNKELIDATLSYTINHTVDYTKLKYGMVIDWSKAKDFPAKLSMNDGDPYCLLFLERPGVSIYYNGTGENIATFSTNDENDTAIFKWDEHLLTEHEMVKIYNLKGDPTPLNTARVYYEEAARDVLKNQSSSEIFVYFDGFKYNQTNGFECDPTFIIYSGVSTSNGGGGIPGYDILFLLGFVSVTTIVINKKRKSSKIVLESN